MKVYRLLVVPVLFVLIAVTNIGGCGGDGEDLFDLDGFCRMRAFTNDFTDRIYFFNDSTRQTDVGVSSNSATLSITVSDMPGVTLFADVVDANNCNITGVTDGQTTSAASGTCERQENGRSLLIENLSALGNNFPILQGLCFDVFFFRNAP